MMVMIIHDICVNPDDHDDLRANPCSK